MAPFCEVVRKLAVSGHIGWEKWDDQEKKNQHLLSYLNCLQVDAKTYIIRYLELLQPYMLECVQFEDGKEQYRCLIDGTYPIYLRVNGKILIVSFRVFDSSKTMLVQTEWDTLTIPVFADEIVAKVREDVYEIKIVMKKGLCELPMILRGTLLKKQFFVERHDVERGWFAFCDDYMKDLYTNRLGVDASQIKIFSKLQQLPYTPYGNDTFTNLSVLLDNVICKDTLRSKNHADMALVIFVQQLVLNKKMREELMKLLQSKYKGYESLLLRIDDILV